MSWTVTICFWILTQLIFAFQQNIAQIPTSSSLCPSSSMVKLELSGYSYDANGVCGSQKPQAVNLRTW